MLCKTDVTPADGVACTGPNRTVTPPDAARREFCTTKSFRSHPTCFGKVKRKTKETKCERNCDSNPTKLVEQIHENKEQKKSVLVTRKKKKKKQMKKNPQRQKNPTEKKKKCRFRVRFFC